MALRTCMPHHAPCTPIFPQGQEHGSACGPYISYAPNGHSPAEAVTSSPTGALLRYRQVIGPPPAWEDQGVSPRHRQVKTRVSRPYQRWPSSQDYPQFFYDGAIVEPNTDTAPKHQCIRTNWWSLVVANTRAEQ